MKIGDIVNIKFDPFICPICNQEARTYADEDPRIFECRKCNAVFRKMPLEPTTARVVNLGFILCPNCLKRKESNNK
jgi:ribosomal protein L37AE/L43A